MGSPVFPIWLPLPWSHSHTFDGSLNIMWPVFSLSVLLLIYVPSDASCNRKCSSGYRWEEAVGWAKRFCWREVGYKSMVGLLEWAF